MTYILLKNFQVANIMMPGIRYVSTNVGSHSNTALNLSDITWKFRTAAMLWTVSIWNVSYKICRQCYDALHKPTATDSLVIIIKPKAKYRYRAVAMLFYILQKINFLTKVS